MLASINAFELKTDELNFRAQPLTCAQGIRIAESPTTRPRVANESWSAIPARATSWTDPPRLRCLARDAYRMGEGAGQPSGGGVGDTGLTAVVQSLGTASAVPVGTVSPFVAQPEGAAASGSELSSTTNCLAGTPYRAAGDTFIAIEGLFGTRFADTFSAATRRERLLLSLPQRSLQPVRHAGSL